MNDITLTQLRRKFGLFILKMKITLRNMKEKEGTENPKAMCCVQFTDITLKNSW